MPNSRKEYVSKMKRFDNNVNIKISKLKNRICKRQVTILAKAKSPNVQKKLQVTCKYLRKSLIYKTEV